MAQSLSAAQKRHLRALAHHLKPVILMGAKGVTESLTAELALALERHELVKVKLAADDREERDAVIEALTSATGAALVQRIGNIAVLFLRNTKQPLIVLPRAP
ncbi:ribosome assembly RNA-binding protein YhbY [Pseudomarimonas salicorniae]|uniref:Ribosome assembly RNA-binding protein YhbY n=1 Tax=Pseudomarimonas salicorniae TaxID=2933270 RepID=A0ABT0GFF1_9GAMM|nr:ribosome assembly RNA-binding protein YhbY [Lysobacter sp. CAU 1642]MCK7593273.1 ribosome assembly RNA-binding protein YhbY [Lysobacter sp. CAU 1642]